MKSISFIFSFICFAIFVHSQTLPPSRSVDWTLAGLRDTTTAAFVQIDMQTKGVFDDGITPNDSILTSVLSTVTSGGAILNFPNGDFLFHNPINLPANVVIKGQGATLTTFSINLNGSGNAFNVQGNSINSDTSSINQDADKDSTFISVLNPSIYSAGNWIQIFQKDSDLITSTWGKNTVGQIVQITNINGNKLQLASPLRLSYPLQRKPFVRKMNPIKNVGIECLKILRLDNTAPEQASNVFFYNAVNCWISGIESMNCTYSHVKAVSSSNLCISKSYMHYGFTYGDSGRAYGVMIETTSNECRVEDNVFEYLRHSMIVQSGANGNVFAYNYSFDPFWTSNPNNSAGDMVLHGNYPYANLFEQNICQNIIIDNSHGPNGPYNTFFRNRAESFGIFFSATNSPNQNIIGNDIPNTSIPYSLVNYTIGGTGHFLYGNNNKGVIDPAGTSALPDLSYAYSQRPDFISLTQWAKIGTPNTMGASNIPAFDRYKSGKIFSGSCGFPSILGLEKGENHEKNVLIYPNPTESMLYIKSKQRIKTIYITNALGQITFHTEKSDMFYRINTTNWIEGIYLVRIGYSDNSCTTEEIIKLR